MYIGVASKIVEDPGSLDIFGWICGLRNHDPRVPSFIPDWTAQVELAEWTDLRKKAFSTDFYNAINGSLAGISLLRHNKLSFTGPLIDCITLVHHKYLSGRHSKPKLL